MARANISLVLSCARQNKGAPNSPHDVLYCGLSSLGGTPPLPNKSTTQECHPLAEVAGDGISEPTACFIKGESTHETDASARLEVGIDGVRRFVDSDRRRLPLPRLVFSVIRLNGAPP
jgi:hypothetical protein